MQARTRRVALASSRRCAVCCLWVHRFVDPRTVGIMGSCCDDAGARRCECCWCETVRSPNLRHCYLPVSQAERGWWCRDNAGETKKNVQRSPGARAGSRSRLRQPRGYGSGGAADDGVAMSLEASAVQKARWVAVTAAFAHEQQTARNAPSRNESATERALRLEEEARRLCAGFPRPPGGKVSATSAHVVARSRRDMR